MNLDTLPSAYSIVYQVLKTKSFITKLQEVALSNVNIVPIIPALRYFPLDQCKRNFPIIRMDIEQIPLSIVLNCHPGQARNY